MPVVNIADVGRYDGQEITLRGWLYNLRESGKLVFPQFRDGTGDSTGRRRHRKKIPKRSPRSAELDAGIERDRHRKDSRRPARARRL